MDNVCHTLVGAAFARAGIAAPVRLGAVTSMIAANLPDVDVLVFATDVPSVAFRRGWTHGILAQATLPALLAGVMFLLARPGRQSIAGGHRGALGPLLVLSYAGVLSHVFLDYLNNYGVRLLMPFSSRWFYGDTLFIIDPWLWIIFGAAVVLGRRARVHLTRRCLVVAGVYILCMMGSARAARGIVLDEWNRTYPTPPQALMVGPAPIDPFRKTIIMDNGDHYRTGTFTWLPPRAAFSDAVVGKHADDPAVAVARLHPQVHGILVWARFPFWEIARGPDGTRVTVRDMRFVGIGRGGFSASVVVFPPSSISLLPSSFFLLPSSFLLSPFFLLVPVDRLEPVVVPRVAEGAVFRAGIEQAQTLADRQVTLHVAAALGTAVQLLPAVFARHFSAMNGYL